MPMNRAEMNTVWTFFAASALFAVLQCGYGAVETYLEPINTVYTHPLLEIGAFAVLFCDSGTRLDDLRPDPKPTSIDDRRPLCRNWLH
jgi:hypothetical protein